MATTCDTAPAAFIDGWCRTGDRDAKRAARERRPPPCAYGQRTRACAQRRTAEGKTKTEIIRCLTRHSAREIYHALSADRQPANAPRRPDGSLSPSPTAPARLDKA